jgi:hypothetical protein
MGEWGTVADVTVGERERERGGGLRGGERPISFSLFFLSVYVS